MGRILHKNKEFLLISSKDFYYLSVCRKFCWIFYFLRVELHIIITAPCIFIMVKYHNIETNS